MRHPDYPGGVYMIDFEFHPEHGRAGNPCTPVCLVVHDVHRQVTHRYWREALLELAQAPFPTDASALVVAYHAPAEMLCFQALGWTPPACLLDLHVEFRNLTNTVPRSGRHGLLDALAYYGEPVMESAHKDAMRALILSAGPWEEAQRQAILDYCAADVEALQRLYRHMTQAQVIDWPRALLRGRYAIAAAASEALGIPLDAPLYRRVRDQGPAARAALIADVDQAFGVYDGLRFSEARFNHWLDRRGLAWPRLPSGRVCLDDDTFKTMAQRDPAIGRLRQLRQMLLQLRTLKLAVGDDGRNRCALFPFSSVTGRNQPSTSQTILGLSRALRPLIRPLPGWALAYVDFAQQELAIAAALSGDVAMQQAYQSQDFYLSFAQLAGAAPPGATKASHPLVRERFKTCALGVLFGMTEYGLAKRLGLSPYEARQLLNTHHRTFPQFWRWSDALIDRVQFTGSMQTVFGWTLHVGRALPERSLRNFPMQAHGAEMLRLAHSELVRRGIRVCAPIHDAVLVEAPLEVIDDVVATTQAVMTEASQVVLDGFSVRSEATVIRAPERFTESADVTMWNRLMRVLDCEDACVAEGD